MKGLVAPFKDSGKLVNIETFNLNWGQFVGSIPSRAHLTAKMTAPIDTNNPALKPLIAAGLDMARSTSISAPPGRKRHAHSF